MKTITLNVPVVKCSGSSHTQTLKDMSQFTWHDMGNSLFVTGNSAFTMENSMATMGNSATTIPALTDALRNYEVDLSQVGSVMGVRVSSLPDSLLGGQPRFTSVRIYDLDRVWYEAISPVSIHAGLMVRVRTTNDNPPRPYLKPSDRVQPATCLMITMDHRNPDWPMVLGDWNLNPKDMVLVNQGFRDLTVHQAEALVEFCNHEWNRFRGVAEAYRDEDEIFQIVYRHDAILEPSEFHFWAHWKRMKAEKRVTDPSWAVATPPFPLSQNIRTPRTWRPNLRRNHTG